MKSDISRQTFDPGKHYNRVVMQQGRVQLDADWNEQQDILAHGIETYTRDVIGQSGVPERDGGFAVGFTADGRDLWISSGRIYVDGILCELEEETTIAVEFVEPNRVLVESWIVDGRAWKQGQWVELLDEDKQLASLFQITAVDQDQQILTLYTDQTNFKISGFQKVQAPKLRRVITYTTQPDYPNPAFTRYTDTGLPELALQDDQNLLLVYLDVWQRHVTALDDLRIREVALGGPDTTTRIQTLWQVKLLPIALSPEFRQKIAEERALSQQLSDLQAVGPTRSESQTSQRIEEIAPRLNQLRQEIQGLFSSFTCSTSYREWDAITAHLTGTLNAQTYTSDNPQNPGYQGLENQLYRVEVHQGSQDDTGSPTSPTFKWAHNNASLLASIEVEDNAVTVHGLGRSGPIYRAGQLVEIVNDETELNAQPGHLAHIVNVDSITGQLTLDSGVSAGNNGNGSVTKLRLWDGQGEIDASGERIPLDGGVEIQFSPGTYRTGDYWLIPARTSTKEIEWPPYQIPNTNPIPQPPEGIQHHYCRLARMRRLNTVSVRDCRNHFLPLAMDAIHIRGINWYNDAIHKRSLLKEGLVITLDAELDAQYRDAMAPSMIVTLETNLPGGGEGSFIIHGSMRLGSNNTSIVWRWEKWEREGFMARLFEEGDEWFRNLFDKPEHFVRVRVRLKGHTIWGYCGNCPIYLDGQTFGIRDLQADRRTPRTDLVFPSGTGARASDFESWFYLRE